MTTENFRVETADGILIAIWDMPGRSMNVITEGVMDDIDAIVAAVTSDASIKGAIIATGKNDFSGGADITMIGGIGEKFRAMQVEAPDSAQATLFEESSRLSRVFRRARGLRKALRRGDPGRLHGRRDGTGARLSRPRHGR